MCIVLQGVYLLYNERIENHIKYSMTRQKRIAASLQETLAPLFLEVQNESRNHHVPPDAETHFKIIAVSSRFVGLSRVSQHRLVHAALQSEFDSGLHAISLHLYTPESWKANSPAIKASPACRDGYDKES